MDGSGLSRLLLVSILSTLFTLSLFYLTLEVPHLIDEVLRNYFRDVFWDIEAREAILSGLRPVGYTSLILIVVLIIMGFVINKGYLSIVGSWALYIPVFGYFALAMFFLAGIGVLRTIWLPLIEYNPNILEWANLVLLPFIIINYFFDGGVSVSLALLIIFIGLLIFSLGAATWLYGKFRGEDLIDFWIYRYIRHPQYLGYIMWSYGILILVYFMPHVKGALLIMPSFPWLISTLVIIGIALNEEIKLLSIYGERYKTYMSNTSFMVPLPKKISSVIMWPARVRHKEIVDKIDIIIVLATYLIVITLLSVVMNLYLAT